MYICYYRKYSFRKQTVEIMCIEVWKLIVSLLTPIIVLVLGLKISRNLERKKIGVLKEKEWQVKWADLFFNEAIEFNTNISIIVCALFDLQKAEPKSNNEKELNDRITKSGNAISQTDWNIQNFSQFAVANNSSLKEKQSKLIAKLTEIMSNRKGDLEEVRQLQFEYNKIVRKVHSEILNSTKDNIGH